MPTCSNKNIAQNNTVLIFSLQLHITFKFFILADGSSRHFRVLRLRFEGVDAQPKRAHSARAPQSSFEADHFGRIYPQLGLHQHQFAKEIGKCQFQTSKLR